MNLSCENFFALISRLGCIALDIARSANNRVRAFEKKRQRYIPIKFGQMTLMFAKGPLRDDRGIGRVARELLQQIMRLASSQSCDKAAPEACMGNRRVYFFPSIHWCPDLLPQPSLVAIHDVIPLIFSDRFPDVSIEWNKRLRPIAQQAQRIITVSDSSASDIIKYLSVPPDMVTVIHNGISRLPVASRPKTKLPSRPYVVFIGTYDQHKNLDVVWSAIEQAGLESVSLVMVGDNKRARKNISEMGLSKRVMITGRLPDSEVGYIISHAKALVLPSLYEGFGLPPLEALLLGTPAICSRRPAMTELLDGLALFADPHDPCEWARCIRKVIEEPPSPEEKKRKADKAAALYSWEAAARKLLNCCLEISMLTKHDLTISH